MLAAADHQMAGYDLNNNNIIMVSISYTDEEVPALSFELEA
jgi:hypothetical protein